MRERRDSNSNIGTRTYAETSTGSAGEVMRMCKPELWQRRSTVVENFQKQGDLGWRITYIIRSRAGSANIPTAISLVLILSLSLSLRLPPSFPPSLILLGLADGFPHAHVPRGHLGEIMNETRTGKGEAECVSRPSYSRFRPARWHKRAQ